MLQVKRLAEMIQLKEYKRNELERVQTSKQIIFTHLEICENYRFSARCTSPNDIKKSTYDFS